MASSFSKAINLYGIYILFIFAIAGVFLLSNMMSPSDESGSIGHAASVNKASSDSSPSISADKPAKAKPSSGSSGSASASAEDSSNPSISSDKAKTSNLSALGVVGICPVISSPGSYVQGGNFSGAPNSVPGFGKACVVIASSNVTFDCNGYNITNNASGGYTNGILVNDLLINVTVKNCPGVSGYSFGIYAYQSTDSIFTNNTAYNNSQDGFDIYSGYNNTFANNTAYNNSWSGFSISSYSIVTKNTAYSNGDGFSIGFYNNINENIAYNNTNGFAIASFNNLTENIAYNNSLGFGIYSNNNTLANNIAYNSYNGFYQQSSSNNNYINNNAYGNEGSGFHISAISTEESSSSNFINNTACNNQEGFILELEDNNLLLNNTACNNTGSGFFINSSYSNNLTNNKAYNNSLVGTCIENSTDTILSNEHYYNNGVDFVINSTDAEINVNLSNVIFDSPAGNYQNFTNLSLMDSMIEENEAYSINWTSTPQELPSHHSSFANKFVNISATYGAPMIDYAEWGWSEDESNGYDGSNFRLWKQNSSGWFLLNDTPDTELNILSVSDLSSFSGFGILKEVPPSGICPDAMLGSGTISNPCQVRTWTNLQAMNQNLTFSYALMNDINSSTVGYGLYQTGSGFTPIGTCSYDGWVCRSNYIFNGTFDGQGFSITGLYIKGGSYAGLFGYAGNANISNIALRDANVSGAYDTGCLMGGALNSFIVNSSVACNVNSTATQAGCLAGYLQQTNMSNCSSVCNITASGRQIGGLIGYAQYANISDCHAISNVNGTSEIGGLIGTMEYNSTVSDSYSIGNVSGRSDYVGGIIGWAYGVTVIRSYSASNVSGGNSVGGLIGTEVIGYLPNNVTDSYSLGNVNGRQAIGGLIGSGTGAVSNSYSAGNVTCNNVSNSYAAVSAGGLIGSALYISIINCSSTGSVNGDHSIGGLIGSATIGNVSNSHSAGNVTGTASGYVGGLIGYAQYLKVINTSATGSVTNSDGAAGGLIGGLLYSTLSNSYATGNTISSYYIAAGLIGAASSSNISDSYALGNASGAYGVAGLIGQAYRISLKRSYATGNVNGTGTYSGGLIGNIGDLSVIDSSYATGNVAGYYYTGGLIGYADCIINSYSPVNSIVNNSYAIGNVSGAYAVGGLIGMEINFNVSNSYAVGNVNATEYMAGGLIGESWHGIIANSFATGRVSGGYPSGGLIGGMVGEYDPPVTIVTNSYWDLCGTDQRRCIGNQCDTPGCYPENYRDNPDSNYFYNYGNGPMESWGYPAWNSTCSGIGYPTLNFQNASLGDCRANEESACTLDPWGSINITYIGTNREVSQGQDFTVDVHIDCTGGDCGNISAVLDPVNPGFANGTVSSSWDGYSYDGYDVFSSWDLVDQGRSYSGKWLAMETGSLAGNCYLIESGYDGDCYDNCYPGYIYLYDDVVPGISAGDSFVIWNTQQECESSFGPKLINWVHTSPDAPGFNQNVICIANITPLSGGNILWANFTVTNPQGNVIINNVNGTQDGQIWSSSDFTTDRGGMWICNVTAFEEGSGAPSSASKKFSITNIQPSINLVNVSAIPAGLGQNVVCTANATDPDDPIFVNFTINDSGNNVIINNIRGTQAGDIWSSQAFLANAPGTWKCVASAVDNDNIPVHSAMDFNVGIKGAIPMNSGTPFYTTDQNPTNSSYVDCLANMQNGSNCNINWNVTASGDGFGWVFFANATEDDNWIIIWDGQTSQKQYCRVVESNHFNVTIVTGSTNTYYRDADGDSYGNASDSIVSITQPEGYVADSTDCDDSNASVNPGATEICNGIDDDCDVSIDEGFAEKGQTCIVGTGACERTGEYICSQNGLSTVCSANPGDPSEEICDEIDNDCDGLIDEEGVCKTFGYDHGKQPPSIIPDELLPLDLMINSIICQSDGTGDITIEARDYRGKPLPGVLISIEGLSRTTGTDGTAKFAGFEKGEHTISASKSGYEKITIDFAVSCQKRETPKPVEPGAIELLTLNIIVKEMSYNNDGTANVKLLVQDSFSNIISDATVNVTGSDILYFTGNDGTVTVRNVNAGAYNATASKNGYSQDRTDFIIKFEVKKEPGEEPSKPPVTGGETLIYSVPYIPILIILLILALIFALWKRRKRKEQVDEAQLKPDVPKHQKS